MSLDLRTGRPVWLINRKQIAHHRKLARNIRCEIAVVGGGVSGALIAHRLATLGNLIPDLISLTKYSDAKLFRFDSKVRIVFWKVGAFIRVPCSGESPFLGMRCHFFF